ncbi:protein of unknown function DUF362 [Desulfovibrio sp. X2]|uniref:DUF362 domain-containing protein n=1 Tax=Desulfovibrio sp. X2 TaxID=941449 RepID=UPI000358A251|nr:DUF362 domain-containing protein [Desulfovibrio sp. X2]EPR44044.1 protein of unknown function DUF362 [Desulfovibrio sp. X2]
MAATVHFWNLRSTHNAPYHARITRLLKKAGAGETVRAGDLTAVKLHFGEAGVTSQLQPLQIKPVVAFLKGLGAKPFLTDTSTLYVGQRGEAVSHCMVASAHGYDAAVLGAPVIMADGLRSTHERAVAVAGNHFTEAFLAADIVEADSMVVLSHFKGHVAAGYGGALKNLAMGCATRKGKMQQHCGMGPRLDPEKCKACGQCIEVCAPGALRLDEKERIAVERELCVGCGACFHACSTGALEVDWGMEHGRFIERMMEYALAVTSNLKRPAVYLNFVLSVTPECDCMGFSDAAICPDLGVLASTDPVALDQACLDLVDAAPPLFPSKLPKGTKAGESKFLALNPKMPAAFGLDYAERLGIGTREYVLKTA